MYRLSRSTLYKLISAKQLHTVKIGGRRLIPRDELESLLNNGAQARTCAQKRRLEMSFCAEYIRAATQNEIHRVAAAAPGTRNDTLCRAP